MDDGLLHPSQIPSETLSSVPQMPNITVSLNGILKLLKDLNPHKAAGPDQLKPLVLQRLCEVIAPVLQVIYQKSLDTGRVPKDWSTAYVCPLFKKRDTKCLYGRLRECHNKITQPIPSTQRKRKPLRTENHIIISKQQHTN